MIRTLPTVAVLALGALTLAGCAAPPGTAPASSPAGSGGPVITARGAGTVSGAPDTATLVLGVQTRDPSAAGALGTAGARATAMVDALRGGGVADPDLQTSALSVSPAFGPDGGRVTGYEATNQVTALVRDVNAVGGLVDAAGAAAGDALRVQGITFSVRDDSDLRARARADAVRQAQAQARQLAEAAGVALGAVRSITEVPAVPVAPFGQQQAVADASTPVQSGSQELTVTVEVVHGIDG